MHKWIFTTGRGMLASLPCLWGFIITRVCTEAIRYFLTCLKSHNFAYFVYRKLMFKQISVHNRQFIYQNIVKTGSILMSVIFYDFLKRRTH